MNDEKQFKVRLESRAERLNRLVKLNAPKQVLAMEVMLVMRAMYGYAPAEMARAHTDWLQKMVRLEAGLCTECGLELEPPRDVYDGFCTTCVGRLRELDDDVSDADLDAELDRIAAAKQEKGNT